MDFKSQLMNDMSIFFNPQEMAETLDIIYNGGHYTVPVIMDHTEAGDRAGAGDHAEGICQVDCILHMALKDIGFVPEKGTTIEIGTEETGYIEYEIKKTGCEDGGITLEMVVYDE